MFDLKVAVKHPICKNTYDLVRGVPCGGDPLSSPQPARGGGRPRSSPRRRPPIFQHFILERFSMRQGYVKFINNDKGFGFIIPDDGDNKSDVFFGLDALDGQFVAKGQRVEFEAVTVPKGQRASKVVPL